MGCTTTDLFINMVSPHSTSVIINKSVPYWDIHSSLRLAYPAEPTFHPAGLNFDQTTWLDLTVKDRSNSFQTTRTKVDNFILLLVCKLRQDTTIINQLILEETVQNKNGCNHRLWICRLSYGEEFHVEECSTSWQIRQVQGRRYRLARRVYGMPDHLP